MNANQEKLALYKDFLHDIPVPADMSWAGEVHIAACNDRDMIVARTVIKDASIISREDKADGTILIELNSDLGADWFVAIPGQTLITEVDLMLFDEKDAHPVNIAVSKIKNISFEIDPHTGNVQVTLPTHLAFPAPKPF
jgi:hypothetical protein